MSPEFRAGERDVSPRLICTECGGRAEGEVSWPDGSGDVCNGCHKSMMAADAASEVRS